MAVLCKAQAHRTDGIGLLPDDLDGLVLLLGDPLVLLLGDPLVLLLDDPLAVVLVTDCCCA